MPLVAGSVDLVSMTGVLHDLDDPLAVLTEVRWVLRHGGVFLLEDWARIPLAKYLRDQPCHRGAPPEGQRAGWLRMFPFHNKCTAED